MDKDKLVALLERIQGCTFAALDADFEPRPGFRKVVTGEVVLLYHTNGTSGYEAMVRRRLAEAGREPSAFVVGDLPWGERVGNLPLIENNGNFYLQTILVKPGEVKAFIGGPLVEEEIPPSMYPDIFISSKEAHSAARSQGLPEDKAVIVKSYKLDSLKEVRLMHDRVKK